MTKKINRPPKKKAQPKRTARRQAGIIRASELMAANQPTTEIARELSKTFRVHERTAWNWIEAAEIHALGQKMAEPEPIQPGLYTMADAIQQPYDPNGHRWRRVALYLRDIDEWRTVRDNYMRAHAMTGDPEEKRKELRSLRTADDRLLQWERQLADVLHFGAIAPDRGLSDRNIRGLIISEIARHIELLTEEERDLLRDALATDDSAEESHDTQLDDVMPEVLTH